MKMTPEATAIVVDKMAANFSAVASTAQQEVWVEHLRGIDVDVCHAAAERVIEHEKFFPTMKVFKGHVADILREQARDEVGKPGPTRDCGFCSGDGWYEVESQGVLKARPCATCSPVETERWEAYKREETRRRRSRQTRSTDPAYRDPVEFIALARDTLSSIGGKS